MTTHDLSSGSFDVVRGASIWGDSRLRFLLDSGGVVGRKPSDCKQHKLELAEMRVLELNVEPVFGFLSCGHLAMDPDTNSAPLRLWNSFRRST